MKKKLMAAVLGATMAASVLAGCGASESTTATTAAKAAETTKAAAAAPAATQAPAATEAPAEGAYAKKLTFTMGGSNNPTGADYETAFTHHIEEMFNVDVEIMGNEDDGRNERIAMQAMSGSLPNVIFDKGFSWDSYYSKVDDGQLKPLPKGWEERWPNMYNMVKASGYYDYLVVDGEVYAVLHSVFGNLADVAEPTLNFGSYLRKDWAVEVGMPTLGDSGVITLEELKAYLEAVEAAGLCDKATIGAELDYIYKMFAMGTGVASVDFADGGNGYEWLPATEGYVDFVSTAQEWYKDGLIDVDFAIKTREDYVNEFATGVIPVTTLNGDINWAAKVYKAFLDANPGKTNDDLIMFQLAAEDGKVYGQGTNNFWGASYFAPETDDETFERILDIVDWTCGNEGQITLQCGIKGVDWEIGADGFVKMINANGKGASENYGDSYSAFAMLGWCSDDLKLSGNDASVDKFIVSQVQKMYAVKEGDTIIPNCTAYNVYSGTPKSTYNGAIKIQNLFSQIVVEGSEVKTALNAFADANKAIWEPVLNDVNEAAGY